MEYLILSEIKIIIIQSDKYKPPIGKMLDRNVPGTSYTQGDEPVDGSCAPAKCSDHVVSNDDGATCTNDYRCTVASDKSPECFINCH